MTRILASGNELRIGQRNVELPDTVQRVVEVEDKIIVLMNTVGRSDYARNVWAFDTDGNRRWKIETADEVRDEHHPYTGISVEEGNLRAYNWAGIDYVVDLESGELERGRLSK